MLVSLKLGTKLELSPLSGRLGVVQATRGAGVVVKRVNVVDGELPQKLNRLTGNNPMIHALLGDLNVFAARMFDSHFVACDVKQPKIVYDKRGDVPPFS